jgi:hypothetical protein
LNEIKYNIVTNRPNISCERFEYVKENERNKENHNEKATPSIYNGKFISLSICSFIAH